MEDSEFDTTVGSDLNDQGETSQQNETLTAPANEIIITKDGKLLRNLSTKSKQPNISMPEISSIIVLPSQGDDNDSNINLESLLRKWNLYDELFSFFRSKRITVEGLLYMKERHLDELFLGRCLNTKIILEQKLGTWQNECGIYNLRPRLEAEVETMSSSVETWINNISSPSTSTNTSEDVSVMDILKKTEQGRAILKSYNDNNVLTPADRTNLVHKVIQHYIEYNIFLSVSKVKNLSEQIIRIFPTENQNTYFIGRGRNPPKGKLWDRYQGRKRSLKKLTSFTKILKPTSLENKIRAYVEEESATYLSSDELKEISGTLKHNRKWDEVILKWKQTMKYRRDIIDADKGKTLQQILVDWPLYKYAQAPELIDIDYKYMYPEKGFSYHQWEKFCKIAMNVFEERIKDSVAKSTLKQLKMKKDSLNTDNVNILYVQLLHAVLVPSSKVINGKRIKYTIDDSQMAFTLPLSQTNEIDGILEEKRKQCMQLKTTLQPRIIVTGANHSYKDFYVSIDDVMFKFNTYLEALEYCFKAFFVFNLHYPNECLSVWIFIQKFLFAIEETDGEFPNVDTLIGDIEHRFSN